MNTFNDLSKQAKIWIYQANQPIPKRTQEDMKTALANFVQEWSAHGTALQAGATIVKDQFVILGVDEDAHAASGCSIDASVHFLKQLAQQHQIELFDRLQIALQLNDRIVTYPLHVLKAKLKSGAIPANALVYNNNVSCKGDLESKWQIPIVNSFLQASLPTA